MNPRLTGLALSLVLLSAPLAAQESNLPERVKTLETEVALLKRVAADQDRRIAELELKLNLASSAARKEVPTPLPGPSESWRTESAWGRLKDGMSEGQVRTILGQPTSTKDVGPYRTLYYRGEVAGSGFISGNVQLSDDRVWQVNEPVF